MRRFSLSKRLRVGAAVAMIAAAGAGAAMIATGQGSSTATLTAVRSAGSSPAAGGRGDLAVAAAYLRLGRAQVRGELRSGRTLAEIADATAGKSASGLIDALVSARAARLRAAVAAKRLPAAKASKGLAGLRKRVSVEVSRIQRSGAGGLRDLAVAASYLGVSPAQLRGDLRSGRTLAAIADATRGRSATGLIEALVAAAKARLTASVAAGALTAADEKARLATLERRVRSLVNRVPRAHA
jgi:hypothetical protein